jgi:hypothetical protein
MRDFARMTAIAALAFVCAASGAHAGPRRGHASGHASGHTSGAPSSFFLAGNPHVPLAVVTGHAITTAVSSDERGKTCGRRARWATVGSRWRAVDVWGKVLGTYAVDGRDHYDVTGCFELSFASAPPRDGSLLFVSEDSAWREPPSAEWAPRAEERAAFATVLARVEGGQSQGALPTSLTEVGPDTRFFDVVSAGKTVHMAVGGRCGGFLVGSFAAGAWTIVKEERAGTRSQRVCHRPLAVFDMTGDGVPEIVLRSIEGDGEWWGDSIIQRAADGRWREVAASPGGSTA